MTGLPVQRMTAIRECRRKRGVMDRKRLLAKVFLASALIAGEGFLGLPRAEGRLRVTPLRAV